MKLWAAAMPETPTLTRDTGQWRADNPEEVEGVYHGEWRAGRRHGQGRLAVGSDDAEWYEGSWRLGRKSGPGTMQYHNGNSYVGEWEDGMRPGPDRMVPLVAAFIMSESPSRPRGVGG
jgi:hypothetical protein